VRPDVVIPTFVIYLREGIEGFMVVAILLAYLDRTGQRRHFRDVFAGVAVALGLCMAGGVTAYLLIHRYEGSRAQTIFETVTYVVAAAVLTYMTFWMQRHARSMSSELERRSDEALTRGARLGLGVLAFQAVGREGVETMVFTLAIVFASSSQAASAGHSRWLLAGAVLGLLLSVGIAWWIYKLGHRMNMGRFFRVLGVLLLVFAAGLLADAVENLQSLGWLPSGHVLWNSSRVVQESSSVGDVFHSLLGYADRPTVLQAVVWVTYLAISLTWFSRLVRRSRGPGRAVPAGGATPTVGPAPTSTV
jgi:high-affinity iron transporter